MAKKPSIKARIKNALEGARAAGLEVGRIVVKLDGEIEIIAGKPMEASAAQANDDLEKWMAKHHAN